MEITRITAKRYGPLRNLDWSPPEVGVVYDDNMAGKTALVDVIVRNLFIPRVDSGLFRDHRRFGDGGTGEGLEVEYSGETYRFGTEEDEAELADLLGWPAEELFRLLCIRAGDNRLVTGSRGRSSVFNAAASLVAGAGTEELDRIDRDLREEFRITGGNDWSNRKTTRPPKIKERIEEEILPFLDGFTSAEEKLHRLRRKEAEIGDLKAELDELEGRRDRLERQLDLIRAKELEGHLAEMERLEGELKEYARIRREDVKAWREAREGLEKSREKLSQEDYRGDRPEEKLEAITEEIEEKEELLGEELEAKIRSKREELKEIREEIEKAEKTAKEKRRRASRLLEEEVREPLKELDRLEGRRKAVRFWEENRTSLGTASGALFVGGGLAALIFPRAGAFLSLVGAGILLAVKRRTDRYRSLSEEIEELEGDITGNFNAEFGYLFDREVRKVEDLERSIEEVPIRAEERAKKESGLSELKDEKRRTEAELEELKEKLERLPGEIEELKSDRERVAERISSAKREVRESREKLADLRDRTNLPDLASLEEELEAKEETERRLREERAVLASKLDSADRGNRKLASLTEREIGDLREGGDELDYDPIAGNGDLEEGRGEVSRQLEELEERIERMSEDLEKRRREIRGLKANLSEFGVDPESPEELFRKKEEMEERLREFVKDRIAGSLAREVLEEVGSGFLGSLNRLISGDRTEKTVEGIFSGVMGDRFSLWFDHETNEFVIEEDGLTYPESDLSSGGRKHLLLSTRLALARGVTPEPGFLVLDDPLLFYHRERKRKAISQLRGFVEEGWQVLFFTVDDRTRDFVVEELEGKELSVQELRR